MDISSSFFLRDGKPSIKKGAKKGASVLIQMAHNLPFLLKAILEKNEGSPISPLFFCGLRLQVFETRYESNFVCPTKVLS